MTTENKERKARIEFSIGEDVILDAEQKVKVVSQTPKLLYTTVTDGDSQWTVMSYRLKKK